VAESGHLDAGARVYASALHAAAADAGRVPEIDADLRQFGQALSENAMLRRALFNPELPRDAKRRIVIGMLSDADPLLRNAMLVIVDNGRLPLLPDMQQAYAQLAAVEERILNVEVTTAVPLGEAQRSDLEQRISAAVGQTARVTATVDPRIVGGLVLQARGVLLDASLRRRLVELRRALVKTRLPIGSEA
jgi:F-type H+-transporting ATPase subunit delta